MREQKTAKVFLSTIVIAPLDKNASQPLFKGNRREPQLRRLFFCSVHLPNKQQTQAIGCK
jgi:hypothetical protein